MSISDRPYKTILKRNVDRLKDADARETNIIASCIMAEVIRTTFGPHGMDKMIIDPVDEIIITNDGATIVKNFDLSLFQNCAVIKGNRTPQKQPANIGCANAP